MSTTTNPQQQQQQPAQGVDVPGGMAKLGATWDAEREVWNVPAERRAELDAWFNEVGFEAQGAPAVQTGQTPPEGTAGTQTGQEAAQEGTVDAAREAVEQAQAAVDREGTGQQGEGQTGDVSALRREAASHRRKLREAERQRDALQERVDRLDREEVERRAGASHGFLQPSDVWLATSIDAMRGEDGLLSDELVGRELGRIHEEHPHWRKPPPDLHPGVRDSAVERRPSFGAALKGRR